MPVKLEEITTPTAQDLIDLEKLFKGCDILPSDLNGSQQDQIKHWIQQFVGQESNGLIGGRFNDRLVGVVALTQCAEKSALLSWIGVRDITRRRGVATQMLTLLQQKHDILPAEGLIPPEISHLLEKAGRS